MENQEKTRKTNESIETLATKGHIPDLAQQTHLTQQTKTIVYVAAQGLI